MATEMTGDAMTGNEIMCNEIVGNAMTGDATTSTGTANSVMTSRKTAPIRTAGAFLFRPSVLLRLKGVALFAASLVLYLGTGSSLWLFALLLLAPDLAMLGYLLGPARGAALYNLAHSTVLPAALALISYASSPALLALALIWLAHIGMDRAVGYGLKYSSGFKDTHLGRV